MYSAYPFLGACEGDWKVDELATQDYCKWYTYRFADKEIEDPPEDVSPRSFIPELPKNSKKRAKTAKTDQTNKRVKIQTDDTSVTLDSTQLGSSRPVVTSENHQAGHSSQLVAGSPILAHTASSASEPLTRTMPATALPDDRFKMDCIPTSSASIPTADTAYGEHDDIANLKNGTEQICPLALDDHHADKDTDPAASFISTESIPILISTPLSTFQAPPSDTTATIPTGKSALRRTWELAR
ncbi:hypothetical protein K439DRAFT_257317 [Ramaria rubella]|nr:hypothetical protein K439DRAFT_257317 [Ramaria rubella]